MTATYFKLYRDKRTGEVVVLSEQTQSKTIKDMDSRIAYSPDTCNFTFIGRRMMDNNKVYEVDNK